MKDEAVLKTAGPDSTQASVIKLAVLAVGGQGGGVLGNWIEAVARGQGYACQATSVAGVAQRTGSTIYYIEMAPDVGRDPVFSLMPSPGDVDIVIGAELMEAGRAIMRGFVTPDRTTLIASSHRVVSIAEKTVPGDGVVKPDEVRAAAEIAAARLIMADLDRVATAHGSVISASLFGALAGSGALPFARAAFEDAIRAGGRGVEASLAAFGAGCDLAAGGAEPDTAATPVPVTDTPEPVGPAGLRADWGDLCRRVAAMPEPVREIAVAGLRKVVGFQGTAYGADYLARLEAVLARDSAGAGWDLSREAAKYVAVAMAYDDVIRVADLKSRGVRATRVADEIGAPEDTVMRVTEYMHPRAEEIVGLFPAGMGARWEANDRRMALLNRLFARGRRVRSDRIGGFLMLYLLGGLRWWRPRTLRHAREVAHLEAWLGMALRQADADYTLGVEILRCRRLVKGYSDTHARGQSKFDRVLGALTMLEGREDAADWVRRLREAALQDEGGEALDGALQTIAGFVDR